MHKLPGSTARLFAIDVETECNVDSCEDKECRHALDARRLRITKIAVTDGTESHVFNSLQELFPWLENAGNVAFTAHNGKFDFKALGIDPSLWVHDSSFLAFLHQDKITDDWLEEYEIKRQLFNKARTGTKHRKAGPHSLKTCAPYYLGVDPFWEPEGGHADDEYVLKDADYCLRLTTYFLERLPAKSLEFYYNHFMPWGRSILEMEGRGITLDYEMLVDEWTTTSLRLEEIDADIKKQWKEHFKSYRKLKEEEVAARYASMRQAARAKGKLTEKAAARYAALEANAKAKIEELNLDSPAQLSWLLTSCLGLDAVNFAGEDSTDKETLTRLSKEDEGVKLLLEHREATKLVNAFFPTYADLVWKPTGRLYTNFNMTTARTGRLSSSDPNMQQCPRGLHEIFKAAPGKLLVTRDLSAIEPTVLGYYSEDPVLCELLINKGDFHGTTAAAAFDLDCSPNEVKKLHPELRNVAKCIDPDTRLLTDTGFEFIGDLSEGREENTFYNIDRLIQGPGGEYVKAYKFYSNGPSPRVRILTRKGEIITSLTHKFKTVCGKLIEAGELCVGDELLYEPLVFSGKKIQQIPLKLFKAQNNIATIQITPELAYFCGMFLGDGAVSHDAVTICSGGSSSEEVEWSTLIESIASDAGFRATVNPLRTNAAGGTSRVITIHGGTHMVSILSQLDLVYFRDRESTTNKMPIKKFRIPNYIFNSTREVKLSFLAGLIDTDGWVCTRGTVGYCSKSSRLASDFVQLAESLGLSCTLQLSWNKSYKRMYYKTYLPASAGIQLKGYIKCSWKAMKLIHPKCKSRNTSPNKILEIERLSDGDVVDISVDTPEHLYNSSGYITHNTVGLAVLYGAGANQVLMVLQKNSVEGASAGMARRIVDRIRRQYKGVWEFKQQLDRELSSGGIIYNLLGRPMRIANADDVYMKGLNTLIQGSASDHMLSCLHAINQTGWIKPLLVVHDEIVCEVDAEHAEEADKFINEVMTSRQLPTAYGNIPIRTEGGINERWIK